MLTTLSGNIIPNYTYLYIPNSTVYIIHKMARKDAKAKIQAKIVTAAQSHAHADTADSNTTNNSSSFSSTTTTNSSSTAGSSTSVTQSLLKEVSNAISVSYKSYIHDVSKSSKLRLIDIFLTFLLALGILQFIFVLVVGTFPFNAFLGGFCSTVGQFVLTVSLRLQSLDTEGKIFGKITPERALGDYIFASVLMHFVVFHFIN